MNKEALPKIEMDGNLIFFWLLNIIKLISLPLVLLIFLVGYGYYDANSKDIPLLAGLFLQIIVSSYCSFLILNLLKNRSENNSKIIIKVLYLEFIAFALLWLLMFLFLDYSVFEDAGDIIIWDTVFLLFWVAYFIRSKHVKAYFGITSK